MRALSGRQAVECENATRPTCRCRCDGAGHGKRRVIIMLLDDDPHIRAYRCEAENLGFGFCDRPSDGFIFIVGIRLAVCRKHAHLAICGDVSRRGHKCPALERGVETGKASDA